MSEGSLQVEDLTDHNNDYEMGFGKMKTVGIGKLVPIQIHFEDLKFSVKLPKKRTWPWQQKVET